MREIRIVLSALLLALTFSASPSPQARTTFAANDELERSSFEDEALALFTQYLKLDTTNPPGNEILAARFFASLCQKAGIEHKVFEPFPGRATFWARVRGTGE